MLFLLTGDVQIGKTRWLEGLIAELQQAGVGVAGVLAPGQWVPSHSPDADKNGFEKLGIDNVLLPEGRRIPFARREDLARAEGAFDEDSQAARSQLAWHISDEAIAQVNAHFDGLMADGVPLTAPSLLVVDELGRLELWSGEGLTSALELLRQGPSARLPVGRSPATASPRLGRSSAHCPQPPVARTGGRGLLAAFELGVVELGVEAVFRQKLFVGSLLHYVTVP